MTRAQRRGDDVSRADGPAEDRKDGPQLQVMEKEGQDGSKVKPAWFEGKWHPGDTEEKKIAGFGGRISLLSGMHWSFGGQLEDSQREPALRWL